MYRDMVGSKYNRETRAQYRGNIILSFLISIFSSSPRQMKMYACRVIYIYERTLTSFFLFCVVLLCERLYSALISVIAIFLESLSIVRNYFFFSVLKRRFIVHFRIFDAISESQLILILMGKIDWNFCWSKILIEYCNP